MTAGDVTAAIREQNRQVAAGRLGQPPTPAGQDFQLTAQHPRPARDRRAVPQHRRQDRHGRQRHLPQGRDRRRPDGRPEGRRAGRQELRRQQLPRRRTLRHPGRSSSCPAPTPWTPPRRSATRWTSCRGNVSRRASQLQDRLRHDRVHRRIDPRSLQDAVRGVRPGLHRRAGLPAGLAGDADADDRRAGVADRHASPSWRCWGSR